METALKLARTFHLANGEPSRFTVIGRRNAYHGNTIAALDAGGKEPLRKPYTPWLGRYLHAPSAYEYRCGNPQHPKGCGAWHAGELERMIHQAPPKSIAAFIAEPLSGATLGAAVPCEDYWPSMVATCREHGVLVIADEVMTGLGRAGRWFGVDHWDVRPDIITAGKGTTERLRALRVRGGERAGVRGGCHAPGSCTGSRGRTTPSERRQRSRSCGSCTRRTWWSAAGSWANDCADFACAPSSWTVRSWAMCGGSGTMIGIELVRDRDTKEPCPRSQRVTERVLAAAREAELLLYSSTGHVDGTNGDLIMLGPPFVLTDEDESTLVERTVGCDTFGGVSGTAGLVHAPQARLYDHGPGHPLRPERVLLTWELIEAYGLTDQPTVQHASGRSGRRRHARARPHPGVHRCHASSGRR